MDECGQGVGGGGRAIYTGSTVTIPAAIMIEEQLKIKNVAQKMTKVCLECVLKHVRLNEVIA